MTEGRYEIQMNQETFGYLLPLIAKCAFIIIIDCEMNEE